MKIILDLLSYSLLFILTLFLIACHNQDTKSRSDQTDILFNSTIRLLSDYTGLIKDAQDSLQVETLLEEVDKGLTSLNFSLPPETDLKLSEQENDSIIKLMEIFKQEVKNKLVTLSEISEDTDSISNPL